MGKNTASMHFKIRDILCCYLQLFKVGDRVSLSYVTFSTGRLILMSFLFSLMGDGEGTQCGITFSYENLL